MEEALRQLFLTKGLTEDMLASIEAGDDSLRSVGDLASGAVSETDARSWADELGLAARVAKSRFVQAWLEARSQLLLALQVASQGQAVLPPAREAAAAALPAEVEPRPAVDEPTPPPTLGPPAPAEERLPAAREAAPAHTVPEAAATTGAAQPGLREGPPTVPRIGGAAQADTGGREPPAPLQPRAAASSWVAEEPWAARAPSPPHEAAGLAAEVVWAPSVFATDGTPGTELGPVRPLEDRLEAEAALQALVPPPGSPEPASRPGGLSDALRKLLRACGLTSVEVAALEEHLEPRTCSELTRAAASRDEAARLARFAGITSKISTENFARAWLQCAIADEQHRIAAETEERSKGPKDYPLFTMLARGDFEACCAFVGRRAGMESKEELISMISRLLALLAARRQRRSGPLTDREKVLPVLASAYGGGVAEQVRGSAEIQEAEWRWRWTLRVLFNARTALALQRQMLAAYRGEAFKAAAAKLSQEWQSRDVTPDLKRKMADIEALCQETVLVDILPRFGFTADAAGTAEMKAAVSQHLRGTPEVRRLQLEISSAVMSEFRL